MGKLGFLGLILCRLFAGEGVVVCSWTDLSCLWSISVDVPHPVVVIINHLWNFDHPCKTVTPNLVEDCFVDHIHSWLLPDTGNSLIICVHCNDHGDNIVVHPSLDLEVVLIVYPIQGVEALIKDIFVLFQCATSPEFQNDLNSWIYVI